MAEIRIKNLQKRFADFTAVRDSSLVLEDGTAIGEVLAIWRYLEDTYPATPDRKSVV